jgi:ferredoxin
MAMNNTTKTSEGCCGCGGCKAYSPELQRATDESCASDQKVSAEFKRPDDTEGGTCD